MEFIIIKILITIDFVYTLIIKLFRKNRFENCLLRLKTYKFLNNYLYERAWRDTIKFLIFGHGQVKFYVTKKHEKSSLRMIDLSKHGFCSGYAMTLDTHRSDYVKSRRKILVNFEKNGKVKFKDELGFNKNDQGIISVCRDDKVSVPIVVRIIELIDLLSFDGSETKSETDKAKRV